MRRTPLAVPFHRRRFSSFLHSPRQRAMRSAWAWGGCGGRLVALPCHTRRHPCPKLMLEQEAVVRRVVLGRALRQVSLGSVSTLGT